MSLYLHLLLNLSSMKKTGPLFFATLLFVQFSLAQNLGSVTDFQKFGGFFDFYYDKANDKILLEVKELNKEFLYAYSLSSGIGSNDIGLDRGQLGNEQVVYFKKVGSKILLVQPNLRFRALTDNVLEKESVEQAFAKSVLFGFKIEEVIDGKYLIDLTDFLMQDMHGIIIRLKDMEQGTYKLDATRSAINLDRTKAFPHNVELDVMLTFQGEAKGSYLSSVTPHPGLVTVTQHHSFIKLPDDKYVKRAFDPRSGSYPFSYYDYATPVQESLHKQFITRHRLMKKNPLDSMSEAVEPIVYYLDNGTPEPIRSALMEGAKWWNDAFEAIGFKEAFQVKILPDDADPLDVRYNVIQWVHRSTRGWSYGNTITDPRTGEIIKGHVSLGSLRIRQDFLIAQALMNKPFAKSDDNHEAMLELALARIRQLSAHEIGHTLGFTHNFAASANGRASVMDYPHPQLSVNNGEIDFSNAYDTGIGEWDKVTVAYSYTDFVDGKDEKKALNSILENATADGLRFISDQDARPIGGAHVMAHLWDNGKIASEELEEVLKVRAMAIKNFSIDNIRTNETHSTLEDVFAPLYFFHRYQTEAAAKVIGGLDYSYTVKGDGQKTWEIVNRNIQEQALQSLINTLRADVLAIPKEKLNLFPPRAIGFGRTRESFKGKTGVTFDAFSPPETAAEMTLRLLLHPERTSRLIQQKALQPNNIGLDNVIDAILAATFYNNYENTYLREIQQNINFRVLGHILNLTTQSEVFPQVNAIAHEQIKKLRTTLLAFDESTYTNDTVRRIDRFYADPNNFEFVIAPAIPDGSPIGMDCLE